MTTNVIRVSGSLHDLARKKGEREHRSTQKQIEHWAFLGQVAEENLDLPLSFIKGALDGLAEMEDGNVSEFVL